MKYTNLDEIFEIDNVPGIYINSLVVTEFYEVVFLSIVGRNAAIQSFLAQVTTGELTSFGVNGYTINIKRNLAKKVGRYPKSAFGEVMHGFLYCPNCSVHNSCGQSIQLSLNEVPEEQVFMMIKSISSIPLLDNWSKEIVSTLACNGMAIWLKTIIGNVYGVQINLVTDEFEQIISSLVKYNQLPIN